ncbi:MAG: TolC family outer membrane protein [Gammaproteobacteria bacterium]|nr:TolC family outer membrane protein [Gammaproteobacteria bacterium]
MKKIISCLITLLAVWSQTLLAADLLEIYCEAVKCDPKFNGAYAELLANRENLPINRSALLPRLDIHGDAERQRVRIDGINFTNFQSTGIFIPIADTNTFYNNHVFYSLKLTQPVFNYKNWSKVQQAKATVKQAEAAFCASAQDLMVRVVRAYFDVMIADANLFYTRENKKAVAEQLRQSKETFRVGVIPITNVYEAQARFDLVIAQEVTERYELAARIEILRTITNHLYCNLKGLSGFLPLVTPQPANITDWVCISEKQNYQLLAAHFATLAAQQNIKIQAGDQLPVVNTFGQFIYSYDSNIQGSGVLLRQQIAQGGVELDWAPIQGGGIIARTNQAQYQYQQACIEQERIRRLVTSQARNSFLGIYAYIAKVNADRALISSSQLSLKATMESYKVGTRTILDVLNQQTQLYNAQKTFIRDRYEYIYQTVLLKQASGTLSVGDIQQINCWLYSTIDIKKYDALLEGCLMPETH